MLHNLYRSTVQFLFLVATLCGLTVCSAVVANAQSDAYPVEVEREAGTWLDLDGVFGTPPAQWPIPRPYLALTKAEFAACPGENLYTCVRVLREKDESNRILAFWGHNNTGCYQDGYRWDNRLGKIVTGIPADYEGAMEGLTFRPCNLMDTSSAASSAASAGSVRSASTMTESVQISNVTPYSATVTANSLNVRSGPGTEYGRKGWLQEGDIVTVTGTDATGEWAYHEYGWSSMLYLKKSSASSPAASSAMTDTVIASSSVTTTAPVSASSVVTSVVPAPLSGPASVRVLSGNVTWSRCGQMWCWNTYRSDSNGGKPATMDVLCDMDGEFLVENVGQSPVKAGNSRLVTGVTAPDRCP